MENPSWSASPQASDQWFVEEIKNGVVVSKHSLSRQCTYFGRAEDVVHIPISHPSSSRVHARIAFDQNSIPHLQDLNSGNGTVVNKKTIPKGNNEQFGFRLYPGDVIQFGASTRIFCLLGPSDFERDNISDTHDKKELQIQHTRLEKPPKLPAETTSTEPVDDNNDGVSWGMDMSDVSDNINDTGNSLPSLDDITSISQIDSSSMAIPPQSKKTYEKFITKKHKLQNIQLENERISKKSIEGLTAGQEKQLEKNRLREVELTKEIQDLYQTLIRSIKGDDNSKKSVKQIKKKRHYEEEDDDVDDFYDRTKKQPKIDSPTKSTSSNENKSESQASLSNKWNKLLVTMLKTESQYEKYERKVKNLTSKLNSVNAEEEKFFIKNDLELIQDSIKKCVQAKAKIEKEVDDVEKLLLVINEKFIFDRDIGVITIDSTKK